MTQVRKRIHREIRASPGIHFNELVRTLDLAPGQVQYHIKQLISTGSIIPESAWGRTHYYPSGIDSEDRRAIAVVRRETSEALLKTLIETDPCSPMDLADDLDIARSTLEYHLDRMVEVGLVEKVHGLGGEVTVSIVDPDRAELLLSLVEPTTVDRLSDRFERLLDQVIERNQ